MRGQSYWIFVTIFLGLLPLAPVHAEINDTNLGVTEIMYDLPGGDIGREWVELMNTGASPVRIQSTSQKADWRFFDTANHLLILAAGSDTVLPGERIIFAQDPVHFLIDHPTYFGSLWKTAMNLPNETATLRVSADGGANWFSERSYTKDLGGAGDGKSLVWNGNQLYPSTDSGGSPGSDGSIAPTPSSTPTIAPAPLPSPSPTATESSSSTAPTIMISEIMYNPTGADSDHEWIELVNVGHDLVTISGGRAGTAWRLAIDGQHFLLTTSGSTLSLPPGDRALIVQDIDRFQEDEPTVTNPTITAGFSLPNDQATIELSADGGDTWFGAQSYAHDLGGDGDGRSLEQVGRGLLASVPIGGTPGSAPLDARNLPPVPPVVISEFLPHPSTGSEDEWIELTNTGTTSVQLDHWTLDDGISVGSVGYLVNVLRSGGTMLAPGAFVIFPKSETRLVLNDDGDSVTLTDLYGRVVDSVTYRVARSGESWIRTNAGETWTLDPTPGKPNHLVTPNSTQNPLTSSTPPATQGVTTEENQPQDVTIEGTVAESFAKSLLLTDESGKIIRVIFDLGNTPKPSIHAGDRLGVRGQMETRNGEPVLVVRDPSAIQINPKNPSTANTAAQIPKTPAKVQLPSFVSRLSSLASRAFTDQKNSGGSGGARRYEQNPGFRWPNLSHTWTIALPTVMLSALIGWVIGMFVLGRPEATTLSLTEEK